MKALLQSCTLVLVHVCATMAHIEHSEQQPKTPRSPPHSLSLSLRVVGTYAALPAIPQAWREQQHRGDEGHRPPDKGFSGGEMAALAVVAGQAAAALRRVGAAASEREEVLQELDAAAADRVDETQVEWIRFRMVGVYICLLWGGVGRVCWSGGGAVIVSVGPRHAVES